MDDLQAKKHLRPRPHTTSRLVNMLDQILLHLCFEAILLYGPCIFFIYIYFSVFL